MLGYEGNKVAMQNIETYILISIAYSVSIKEINHKSLLCALSHEVHLSDAVFNVLVSTGAVMIGLLSV